MTIKWEVLMTAPASAETNMAMDRDLLASLEKNPRCILHFYQWEERSATYGYFINPALYFCESGLKKNSIQIAKRSTGGGIIFHHCDLAFAVLIPSCHPLYTFNTLLSYANINQIVSLAFRQLTDNKIPLNLLEQHSPSSSLYAHFCMAQPTVYDIMLNGLKIGGAAQRKKRWGILHQGSLALALPSKNLLQEILPTQLGLAEEMQQHSYNFLGETYSNQLFEEVRRELQFLLLKAFLSE